MCVFVCLQTISWFLHYTRNWSLFKLRGIFWSCFYQSQILILCVCVCVFANYPLISSLYKKCKLIQIKKYFLIMLLPITNFNLLCKCLCVCKLSAVQSCSFILSVTISGVTYVIGQFIIYSVWIHSWYSNKQMWLVSYGTVFKDMGGEE